MKHICLLIILLLSFSIKGQNSSDTIFIKKDIYQKIYIEKNRNANDYNMLINFNDFKSLKEDKIRSLGLDSKWIRIYKYKTGYILYEPCDFCVHTQIKISNKYIQWKNCENVEFKICSIKKNGDDVIIKYKEPNFFKKTTLTIEPIDKKLGIYKFIIDDGIAGYEYIMLESEKYKNFDILINDCKEKLEEFDFKQ